MMKKIYALIFTLFVASAAMAQDTLVVNRDCAKGVQLVKESKYDYVDLGLPSGLKWATCNVGAANPWDYGDYFAWGETVGYGKSDPSNGIVKTYYDWSGYKYCNGSNSWTLTKYNYNSSYGSVVDNKTSLEPADDAAHVNMGGSWRMPTAAEQKELINNCYWEWTDSYDGKGVSGYIVYKVKSASDKGKKKYGGSSTTTVGTYSLADPHIFLPTAGCRNESGLNYNGSIGSYWSSSLCGSDSRFGGPYDAYLLDFSSVNVYGNIIDNRCHGHSVRGVNDVPSVYTITVTSNNSQYGTVSGGGDYEYNANATISATPNEGYKFLYWSDGNEENPRLVVVLSDIGYTAVFEEIPPATGITNGYSWVDLGLPSGLKWATCNVGAENPWDYGDYFAWGETVGYGKSDPSNAHNYAYSNTYVKTYYAWNTYKWCNGTTENTLTKYNINNYYGSVVDNKTVLNLEDDAARANMGSFWRMPTWDEQQELLNNCYWEWTDDYNGKGVKGYVVYKVKNTSDKGEKKYKGKTVTLVGSYSLADAHIFLPAAGGLNENEFHNIGSDGLYWSSLLNEGSPNHVYYMRFNSDYVDRYDSGRYEGHSVRGVMNDVPSVYTITVTSNNSQYGTVSGGGDYEYNANATISATPNEGYKFLYWSDGNEENPRLVVVLSDIEYTAVFEEIPPATGITNGYSWVDLGLPSGLKWATCNVGAENPWDYGDYFAWGETALKSVYDWSTYLDGRITDEEDCGTSKDLLNGITAINGTQYDAARANMGGEWRMPTKEEINELYSNCYWEWTTNYNAQSVKGYIVYKAKDASDKGKKKMYSGPNSTVTTAATYSLTDVHIFLPTTGVRADSYLNYDHYGYYWSSSLSTSSPSEACDLSFSSDYMYKDGTGSRYYGNPVRGVIAHSSSEPPFSVVDYSCVQLNAMESTYGYTIGVKANGCDLYEHQVEEGKLLVIKAEAGAGYHFVQWNDGNKENPRQIVVMSDMIYTAVFEEDVDGIADITAAGINIYTEGRTIIVENATDAITVSDALGRVVGKDDAHIVLAETRKFPVPSSGVYVVKIGNRAASVLVR